MIRRPAWAFPTKFAFAFGDRNVIDARLAPLHVAERIEFPLLVTVAAKPVAFRIVPFVCESHGDAIVRKGPNFFDEPILDFAGPFAFEERQRLSGV